MKYLYKLRNINSVFLLLTVFVIQSCDESDKNLAPNQFDLELSKAPQRSGSNWMDFTGQLPDPCKSVCLVAGQHDYVGTVDVAIDGDYLLVTYNVTEPDIYIEEVHLEIFSSIEELEAAKKISGGGAIPGKFDYKKSWSASDMITMHTVKIPLSGLDDCFFIASHAALSNGETAWGGLCDVSDKGVSLDGAKQFPGRNWSVFFEFCQEECVEEIDFTYAWEDLQNSGNDGDYNDLVIQADVIKSVSELKVTFLASARGAAYDHKFKIKIPMLGIDGIFGEASVVNDGTFYYITVFESTKAALPEFVNGFSANTFASDVTCTPNGTAEITLTINSDFTFDPLTPYEPFITVYPSGTAGDGINYDLYIWEVSGGSTWNNGTNDFPNGILIPRDWEWPLEHQIITGPYPDFGDIITWNVLWADNLVNSALVWSCTP